MLALREVAAEVPEEVRTDLMAGTIRPGERIDAGRDHVRIGEGKVGLPRFVTGGVVVGAAVVRNEAQPGQEEGEVRLNPVRGVEQITHHTRTGLTTTVHGQDHELWWLLTGLQPDRFQAGLRLRR